jgi:hypothetical protein
MSILNYGMFWRREEVEWHPGTGSDFRLIGRQGERKPGLRMADFREQSGIYILYGNYGVFYVGISEQLGIRLRNHHDNHTETEWDRFSWFGFRRVLQRKDYATSFADLAEMPQVRLSNPVEGIKDLESLLIRAMGPSGQRIETFTHEERWEQVGEDEIEHYQRLLGWA